MHFAVCCFGNHGRTMARVLSPKGGGKETVHGCTALKARAPQWCCTHLLVGRGGGDDEVVPVHVGGLGGDGRHVAALARLLLDLRDLLPLLAGRRDLRAQDDVADLALRQRLWAWARWRGTRAEGEAEKQRRGSYAHTEHSNDRRLPSHTCMPHRQQQCYGNTHKDTAQRTCVLTLFFLP